MNQPEQPVGGMFVISKSFEEIGISLKALAELHISTPVSRLLWYPDGSLGIHQSGERWWDFGEVYTRHCRLVHEANAKYLRHHFSYESRIRIPAHSQLPNEVAQVRVCGRTIAKRKDSHSINFLAKRWPDATAHEPTLEDLAVTIGWPKPLTAEDCDVLLDTARSLEAMEGGRETDKWRTQVRLKRIDFSRSSVRLHGDFSAASLHDFAWLVIHFAKTDVVQRSEFFSIVDQQSESSGAAPPAQRSIPL